MLIADFVKANLNEGGEPAFLRLEEMVSVFDAYQSKTTGRFYLFPKQGRTSENAPIICIDGEKVEIIKYDNTPGSEYRKLVEQKELVSLLPNEDLEKYDILLCPPCFSEGTRDSLRNLLGNTFEYQEV